MPVRKPEKLLTSKLARLTAVTSPVDRLAAVREVTAAADALEHAVVAEARDAGLTWTEIGAAFGMTKQAAQQRFKSGKPKSAST